MMSVGGSVSSSLQTETTPIMDRIAYLYNNIAKE